MNNINDILFYLYDKLEENKGKSKEIIVDAQLLKNVVDHFLYEDSMNKKEQLYSDEKTIFVSKIDAEICRYKDIVNSKGVRPIRVLECLEIIRVLLSLKYDDKKISDRHYNDMLKKAEERLVSEHWLTKKID